MGKKLYVGNLPYSYTSQQLQELFAPHGNVSRRRAQATKKGVRAW